jgi:hypothetical protein
MTKTIVAGLALLLLLTACEKKSESNFDACIEAYLKANNMVRYKNQDLGCRFFASLYELDGQPYFDLGNNCADMLPRPVDCSGNPFTPVAVFFERATLKGIVGVATICENTVYVPGKPFELCIGQKAEGEVGTPRSITLQDITFDNRCPLNVNCISEGRVDARVELVSPDLYTTKSTVLSIGNFGELRSDSARLGDYVIKMKNVAPYRESGKPINARDYRVVFEVYKAR